MTMGKPLRNVWAETLVEIGAEDDRVPKTTKWW
jgi:hypothetical protein